MTDFDIYVQWAAAAVVALAIIGRGQMTLFHPSAIYLVFHVVVFCLRPTLVHFYDFDSAFRFMNLFPRGDDLRLALHLSTAGLVVFFLAFSIFSRGADELDFGEPDEFTGLDKKAFAHTALLFGPAGLYSIFGLRGSVYLTDLQYVLLPLCLLLLLLFRWRWWTYLPFLAVVFLQVTQDWGRWSPALSFFLLVLVWSWDQGRRFPAARFLVPMLLVFGLLVGLGDERAFWRSWVEDGRARNVEPVEASRDWRTNWDTLEFATFDSLTYIVTHVPLRTKTHTFGTQYLQLFTEPIPRVLWKDKPTGPPVELFDLNDYGNFTGLTPSLVGDGWMSGGWAGAMLTMLLAGAGLGQAFTWFTKNQASVHRACIFMVINAMAIHLHRDGGIAIFTMLLFALAPFFLWAYLSHRYQLLADVRVERESLREARERRRLGLRPEETEEPTYGASGGDDDDDEFEDEESDDDWEDEEDFDDPEADRHERAR